MFCFFFAAFLTFVKIRFNDWDGMGGMDNLVHLALVGVFFLLFILVI